MSTTPKTRCGFTKKQWEAADEYAGEPVFSPRQELLVCASFVEQAAMQLPQRQCTAVRQLCHAITMRSNVEQWLERSDSPHMQNFLRALEHQHGLQGYLKGVLYDAFHTYRGEPGTALILLGSCAGLGGLQEKKQRIEGIRSLFQSVKFFRQLFHDIAGPFDPVTWRESWRTHATTNIAQVIDDSRAFEAMPILADALEEAGCDDVHVLNHCRGPNIHVRGCHVIEGILGKL